MKTLIRPLSRALILPVFLVALSGCFDGPTSGTSTGNPPTETSDSAPIPGSLSAARQDVRAAADSVTAAALQSAADSVDGSSLERLSRAISALAASIEGYNAGSDDQQRPGDMTIGQVGDEVQNYTVRIFWTLVLMIATYFFVRGLTFVLEKVSEVSAERRLFYKRLVPISRVLVWSVTIYFIIKVVFEVNNQSLLAAAAAVGVAIGFAAQDIVKNVMGGFVIISDRPFQVGDKILIDGTYGEVTAIGLRSTRIVTPDDSVVTVPNAQVISSQVSNANTGALDCQVVTDLYLPGWVDEAKAKRIAFEAAATSKYAYLQKPIVVLVKDEFKETFITHIKVKAYVLDTRYEFLLMSDVTEKARLAFRKAGLLRDMYSTKAFVDFSNLPFGPGEINGDPDQPPGSVGPTDHLA